MKKKQPIGELSKEYRSLEIASLPAFIEKLMGDERTGAKKLAEQAKKRLIHYEEELARTEGLKVYEKKYWEYYDFLCGIDEAGRGPLAGPVVAGAVILPKDTHLLYINDSKKLSRKKREELYEKIREEAVAVGVGMASPEEIDKINVLQATYVAMRRALLELSVKPDMLLIDAFLLPEMDIPQEGIIKGDEKSISIGAASIIAKVTRDRLMMEYDKEMPQYGFCHHVGYGTKEHYAALRKYGISPIHRRSFLKETDLS